MLRLAHIILNTPDRAIWRGSSTRDAVAATNMKRVMEESPAIILDNVSEYYAASPKQEWDSSDCPICTLPFPACWLEFKDTKVWDIGNGPEVIEDKDELMHGAVCIQMDMKTAKPMLRERLSGYANGSEMVATMNQASAVIIVTPFAQNPTIKSMAAMAAVTAFIWLREDGSPINWTAVPEMDRVEHLPDEVWASFGSIMNVLMLGLSFANCKRVVRRDVTEAQGPPRKWLKRQKSPEIRYHILDINPMKEVLRTEGGIEANGLGKALHICRGHFATYTAEKPLFGKYTGTFWVPAHVKGSVEHGIVDKDYRIKAPIPPITTN